ncbi:MAG: hypothetical protein Q9180_002213 [Flavoplaca navasiana]
MKLSSIACCALPPGASRHHRWFCRAGDRVQGIVDRYKKSRLRFLKNSDILLQQILGGWIILQLKQQCSRNLKEKLAQLCRLGILKFQAIERLKAKIESRRTGNKVGVAKTPNLLPADVAAVLKELNQVGKPEQPPATPRSPQPPQPQTLDDKDDKSNGPVDPMWQPGNLQTDPEGSRRSGERGSRQAHVLPQSERGPAERVGDGKEEETEHETEVRTGISQEERAGSREKDQRSRADLSGSMDRVRSQLESRKRRKTSDTFSSPGNLDLANPSKFVNNLSGRSSRRNSPYLEPIIDDQTAITLRLPQTSVQATLHQRPPESTLLAAIKFFGWLTITAVQVALGMLPSNNVKISDPSYMETANPESMLRKRSKSDWLDMFSVFPTNHYGRHWTLVVYDPSNCEVEFYSSLRSTSYEREAERAMRCCIEAAHHGQPASVEVSFQRKDCPRRHNASDSGVFIILCAISRILGQPMPFAFDYWLWRITLHAVLSQGLPENERFTVMTSTPTTKNNTSQTVMDTAPRQDDISTLTRDFDSKAHEHEVARACCFLVKDAINTLDIILQRLQVKMDAATERLHRNQKALDEHRAALDDYRKIGITHEAIIHTSCLKP